MLADGALQEVRQKALRRMSEGFLSKVHSTIHMDALALRQCVKLLSDALAVNASGISRPCDPNCGTAEAGAERAASFTHFCSCQSIPLHSISASNNQQSL